MKRTIAIFGGSFNPPGLHHRAIAQAVAELPGIDEVIVVPCGIRPDKSTTNTIPSVHRAAMVDMTFADLPKITVDLSDLESNTMFTPNIDLERRYKADGYDVWHVVGSDLTTGGKRGESTIQRTWKSGHQLWKNSRFILINRPGSPNTDIDLPPHNHVIPGVESGGSSTEIRERIYNGKPFEHLVTPRVAEYIKRYQLYKGGVIPHQAIWNPPDRIVRAYCLTNHHNSAAMRTATRINESYILDSEKPDLIVSIGGDGRLLDSIRSNWYRRIPFVGINQGHLGFLLNQPDIELEQALTVFHLPLLYVEVVDAKGKTHREIAFNDVWWERSSPSTAWMRVAVNGKTRIKKLEADGILVAAPQGSAAYARSMGAPPVPLNSQALIMVGNNVARPNWRFAILPTDAEIMVTNLEAEHRAIRAVIDGNLVIEDVVSMKVRRSRTAAVELLFDPRLDIGAKMIAAQFPK